MYLVPRIRALITALVLASWSPFGLGFGLDDGGSRHAGHLAISIFLGRRTRVAASQQFDVTNRVVVRCPTLRAADSADDEGRVTHHP